MSAEVASQYDLTSEAEYRLDLPRVLIVFSVMLAVMLEIIDTSIVNVALPSMMGNLGATLDEIDWVVTSYIVANVIVIPLTGWMAARCSNSISRIRRRVRRMPHTTKCLPALNRTW